MQADAVRRAGPSVKFVNYDSYVGEFASRYCEAGVDESTTESNARLVPLDWLLDMTICFRLTMSQRGVDVL